ncbi:MAG: hypothetical protein WD904_05610 [Dehalococcoidia bacterium]
MSNTTPSLTTDSGQTNDYSLLLLIQEEPSDDSQAVQHFVCSNCLDLVESEQGSQQSHDCPMRTS